MKNKIALALIVKGDDKEALLLQRCLSSVSKYVDSIYITRTQKIGEKKNLAISKVANEFNAVLSDFEWTYDFAEARNFNFSQVPKEYDWIMWTDADDIWRGLEKLKKTIAKHSNSDGFGFWYLYDWDEWKKPIVVHRKTMIVRNDGSTKWVGAIHEDLEPTRQVDISLVEGIERLHITTKERSNENALRNLQIAEKEVEVKSSDPRSYWNLANSQFAVSDFDASKKSFSQFIENSESTEEKYLAHTRLADVFKALGNRESSIQQLQIAIGLEPTLPDAYLQLSSYYYTYGDMDKAEHYCIQGLLKRPQIMKMVVYNPRDYDYNPMMLLAKIYSSKNRPDLMLPMLKGCLKIYPNDKQLKHYVKQGESEVKILEKALTIVKRLQEIKDKEELAKELAKVPIELVSHPAISVIRNTNFIKEESSGKDLVIYCGNTIQQWNAELFKTKGIGGSEEAVVHLAREYARLGWNVTVYNNCGHKKIVTDGVTYKPFWEWNYRDKQDVVILWRWAKPLDAHINAPKIFLDLHDVVSEGELTEKRLQKVTKVFVKTKFHRSLFPNVPDHKFAIVPNGMELYIDETIKKDPFLMINTSSPDRSLDVLPELFREIKKKIPKARLQWAYGWDGFLSMYSSDNKKLEWMEKVKKEMEEAGIETLGRISQKEVGELYQRASFLLYPTEFAEIDCISVKKAQGAKCMPIATDFGALDESIVWGHKVHSLKTKDTWNKPYQFHFGLEDEDEKKLWIDTAIKAIKDKEKIPEEMLSEWKKQFAWSEIAKRWIAEFNDKPLIKIKL